MRALERAPEEHSVVVAMGGSFVRGDLETLCDRMCAILADNEAERIICDVGEVDPDAVAVDALARLQLLARRAGHEVRLRHVCARLGELVELAGLSDVLPPAPDLALEAKRQSEEREEAGRVEEESDAADPPVGDL